MTTDNFCFYFQNRLIQTSQTGGQWYSDPSPFRIPWYCHIKQQWPIGACFHAVCRLQRLSGSATVVSYARKTFIAWARDVTIYRFYINDLIL